MGVTIEHLTAAVAERDQRRIAAGLAARGLADADRVALVAASSGTLLLAVLALLRSGTIPVVVSDALTSSERRSVLDDADPAAVLGLGDLEQLRSTDGERELAPVPLGRPLHYTSGTTGRPKGVWTGVLSERDGQALIDEERELWHFDADDHHVVCSPLHHSAPIRFAAGTLSAGGSVSVLSRFDRAALGGVCRASSGPLTAFMVPSHFQRIAAGRGVDTAAFRLVAHAGAPCPEPLKRWALDAFPSGSVWEFYGSTEGQFTVCSPDDWCSRPGTVGRARPGRRLEADADGTLWCAVPDHARFTYWRNPDATAAAWRGSAFTVGDLGRIDADGWVHLDGRRDDLVISGGVNVYPAEVEAILTGLAGVEDVAVYGEPDERWGQRVCAAVVGDASDAAIDAFARDNLAPPKRPRRIVRVSALPRTATGKVLRRALADQPGSGSNPA